MPVTVLISDLHLGASSGHDVLRRPAMRERLLEAIDRAGAERLVLLGDIVELRDGPLGESLGETREFFEAVGRHSRAATSCSSPATTTTGCSAPGSSAPAMASARPRSTSSSIEPHPAVATIADWLGEARLEVRYPGIWVRDDVYATHGHYLDSHVTLPTIERLSVATVDRLGGTPTGRRRVRQRLRAGPRARLRPHLQPRPGRAERRGRSRTAARRRCESGRRSAAPPAGRGRSAASCSDRR